jgi:hypothetical protein
MEQLLSLNYGKKGAEGSIAKQGTQAQYNLAMCLIAYAAIG